MPVKRRSSKARQFKITPAVLAAFRADDDRALHVALNLPPWFPNPLFVDWPEPPVWARNDGTAWTACWPEAWALRQELERGR
ncbi:hypothetical protein [Mesorhizobium sophorae]|uniref:hypothetical protein n=1 Tax=Mesorhizobium sophorae TaxID=1300294 RepID=UPI000BA31090|nr:hypothetical protein [Mesorhizobium sophorae]